MTTEPTTNPGPGPDPLAAVRKGDRRSVFLTQGTRARCGEISPRGAICSRALHPPEWQHIAAGSMRVVETWGGTE